MCCVFLLNKTDKVAVKQIRSALNAFYIADDIAAAKMRSSEDIKSLESSTKLPHVPQRRDGDGRLAREVDDIISLVTFLDEQKLLNSVPRYVASSPDRMPSI